MVAGPPNPISVPVINDEFAWDQIADVVSDYFKIAREQRARRGSEGFCEGRIDTVPRDSATWFEPHRKDSIGTFNRWESTFQTIRRRATGASNSRSEWLPGRGNRGERARGFAATRTRDRGPRFIQRQSNRCLIAERSA